MEGVLDASPRGAPASPGRATPRADAAHRPHKRHYYTACAGAGETLTWNSQWYTQDWFTSSRGFFDSAASLGPIDPPESVWITDPACRVLESALGTTVTTQAPYTLPTTSDGALVTASAGDLSTVQPGALTTMAAATTTFTSTRADGRTTVVTQTTQRPVTATVLPSSSRSFSSLQSASISSSTSSSMVPSATALSNTANDPSSITTCAGGWDWMATGAVSSAIFGLLVGFLVWTAFGMLRRKIPMYTAATWFLPEDRRPAGITSFFASFTLLPILKAATLRTKEDAPPPDDARIGVITVLTALKLAVLAGLVGLAAALPLYLVKVPCLQETSPTSAFGGRLGTLTDLSLLRLLNALDPSPDSNIAMRQTLVIPWRRALMSTIFPAISGARTRLIVLVVILFAVLIFPSMFLVWRTLRSLLRFRFKWLEETCGGEDMVWIRHRSRNGSAALTEKEVKELAQTCGVTRAKQRQSRYIEDLGQEEKQAREKTTEVVGGPAVRAVYAIPDTERLSKLVKERRKVLDLLERAETHYIRSFYLSSTAGSPTVTEQPVAGSLARRSSSRAGRLVPPYQTGIRRQRTRSDTTAPQTGGRTAPTTYVAPRAFYHLSELPAERGASSLASPAGDQTPVTSHASFGQDVDARVTGSKFLEVTRDSAFFGGKLPIGTPMKIGENGLLDVDHENQRAPGPRHTTLSPQEDSADGHISTRTFGRPSRHLKPMGSRLARLTMGSARTSHSLISPSIARETRSEDGGTRSPRMEETVPDTPSTQRLHATAPPTSAGSHFLASPADLSRAISPDLGPNAVERPLLDEQWQAPNQQDRSPSFEFIPDTDPALRLGHRPAVRPLSSAANDLGEYYREIGRNRSRLKELNDAINQQQADLYERMADGSAIKGFILIGPHLSSLGEAIPGRTRGDVKWSRLQRKRGSLLVWLILVILITTFACLAVLPFLGLSVATAPGFNHYLGFLRPLAQSEGIEAGIVEGLIPGLAVALIFAAAAALIAASTALSGAISRAHCRLRALQGISFLLLFAAGVWTVASTGILFAAEGIDLNSQVARRIGDGSVFSSWMLFCLLLNAAVTVPGLYLLRPIRLLRVWRESRRAVTPRDRFRATYPRPFSPAFAFTGCLIALLYGAIFIVIFPLICLPIILFLVLMLIATHYSARYVNLNVEADSGALFEIWTLRIFGWIVALGPTLLGLVLLSRREFELGGVTVGVSLATLLGFEWWVWRQLGRETRIAKADKQALKRFKLGMQRKTRTAITATSETEAVSPFADQEAIRRRRQSNHSILQLIAGLTGGDPVRAPTGPLPLPTDAIDDMFSAEQAARAHPQVPPRLPPLPFDEVTDQCRTLMYPPDLLAPPPTIWLEDDEAGVARAEAEDLMRYHQLKAIVDTGAGAGARV